MMYLTVTIFHAYFTAILQGQLSCIAAEHQPSASNTMCVCAAVYDDTN